MADLTEQQTAPLFDLPSLDGSISLTGYKNKKNVILYFYPKDNTPGCTQEACDFQAAKKKWESLDAVVLGVSADSLESHRKFSDKWKLTFPLLSDESKSVLNKYGVWKEKSLYGRKFMGIERTTFLIDKKGKIRKVFRKVKVKEHLAEVLEALKAL